jgi:3',5'-cyclic AMP phosphodiesterase CpdA
MTFKRKALYLIFLFIISLFGCNKDTTKLNQGYKIKEGNDLSFYIATDIHYLSRNLNDGGEAFKKFISSGDGKQLEYIDEILNAFTNHVKNKKPDFLIISGDLTTNGEKESHLGLAEKLSQVEKGGTSVYVIPGNHDIFNPWARSFKGDKQYVTETINSKEFSEIYGEFGYEEALMRDKDTLSYLAAPSEDVWLLMLDTNQYKNNQSLGAPQGDGEIPKKTLEWIKDCSNLAKEKGARIVTVMHHSLITHSQAVRKGYTLNNSEEVLEVFQALDLNLVLSGHIHIQDISSYKNEGSEIYDIATGSLAVYPQKYGMLNYSHESESFDYSTAWVDVESWSMKSGMSDENLKDFRNYSEKAFGKTAYDMAYKQLLHYDHYTIDEIKAMSETMRKLNIRHFSGTENLNSKDITSSEGYKLWEDSPQDSFRRYIMSMLEDKDTDDNSLKIMPKGQ